MLKEIGFWGAVLDQRRIAAKIWKEISWQELSELVGSDIHEHRYMALLMSVQKFQKTKDVKKQKV